MSEQRDNFANDGPVHTRHRRRRAQIISNLRPISIPEDAAPAYYVEALGERHPPKSPFLNRTPRPLRERQRDTPASTTPKKASPAGKTRMNSGDDLDEIDAQSSKKVYPLNEVVYGGKEHGINVIDFQPLAPAAQAKSRLGAMASFPEPRAAGFRPTSIAERVSSWEHADEKPKSYIIASREEEHSEFYLLPAVAYKPPK